MSVLYPSMAYNQVPMNPAKMNPAKTYCMLYTQWENGGGGVLYQNVTMLFGLWNAGATFQRIIETSMRKLQWHVLVLYLDNKTVFRETFDEHLVN